MWDTVEVVHRSIDGVHDPLHGSILVPGDTLFTIECMVREAVEQDLGDQVL